MNDLTKEFFDFLSEMHKRTGQNSFILVEYRNFDGYERAINDLSNLGIIEKTNDIYGTIIVHLPDE